MATNKTPHPREMRQESLATIFRRANTMDAPKLSHAALAKSFAKAATLLERAALAHKAAATTVEAS